MSNLSSKAMDTFLGTKHGRLIVVSKVKTPGYKNTRYLCVCDCGAETLVQAWSLKSGHTTSCGCFQREMVRLIKQNQTTHGMSRSKEYVSWSGMIRRTTRPNNAKWHRYGGRGITVCDEWRSSFEQFMEDMGTAPSQRHQLDRIDNDQGYYAGNCRWATPKMNMRNTCINVFVEYNGQRKTVAEWSEIIGIRRPTLYKRIKSGWPTHRAFTEPPKSGNNGIR